MPGHVASPCPSLEELDSFVAEGSSNAMIMRHLEGCAACTNQIERIQSNAHLLSDLAVLGQETPVAADPTGTTIDGYEVIGELHRGGQGVILEAIQTATARRAAVKLLLQGALATSRQRHRFDREVEVAATLNHPGIVTVYESGETTDGRHYLAMELIDGVPLDQFMTHARGGESRSLPLTAALQLFADIAGAVGYAHQRGVIHRDLKPANILVDGDGHPHIVDFGLAKALEADDHARFTMTQTGEFMGTLAYASPEHVSGEPDAIDVRSDVYSLGVILYQMLTGRLPYPVTGSLDSIIHAITHDPPLSFHRSSPDSHATPPAPYRLDNEVETIILKALSKDPERRYQSANELRQDIEHYLAGDPIDAKRDSTWYVFRKSVRRHKWAMTAIVGFVVLLAAFATLMTIQSGIVTAERDTAREEGRKSREITEFYQFLLTGADPRTYGQDVTVLELLDVAAERVESQQPDSPEIEAAIRDALGTAYDNLGDHAKAKHHLALALELRRGAHDPPHADIARSAHHLAEAHRHLHEFDAASPLYREALQVYRDLPDGEARDIGIVSHDLGLLLLEMGEYDEAEDHLRDAISILEPDAEGPDPAYAASFNALADILMRRGEMEAAETMIRDALDAQLEWRGEEHLATADAMNNLAALLIRQRRFEEAESLFGDALAIQLRLLPPMHQDLAVGYNNLAIAQLEQDKIVEATESAETARVIYEESVPADHLNALENLNTLATLLIIQDRFPEAEVRYLDLLPRMEAKAGADHPQLAAPLSNLGLALHRQGKNAAAEPVLARAIEIDRAVSERSTDLAVDLMNYALVMSALRRIPEAETTYRELHDLRSDLFGPESVEAIEALRGVARSIRNQGRLPDAEPVFVRLLALQEKALPATDIALADTHRNLGRIYLAFDRNDDAEAHLAVSAEVLLHHVDRSDLQYQMTNNERAAALIRLRRYPEAEPLLLENFEVWSRLLGPDDPRVIGTIGYLIALYDQTDRPELAQEYRDKLPDSDRDQTG